MIPSTQRRTWTFLVISSLAFFVPDMLVPAAWSKLPAYIAFSSLYQGLLVLVGFWFGPRICQAMVVVELTNGPLRQAVDDALEALRRPAAAGLVTTMPVTLARHPAAFVITAGLLPSRSEVFLSTAMVARLGPAGLRFLLARALAHGGRSQRLAAILPVLILTGMLTDTPTSTKDWLGLAGLLLGWLALHWYFELRADRQAARLLEADALEGLRAVLSAQASPARTMFLQPPARWRLRLLGSN